MQIIRSLKRLAFAIRASLVTYLTTRDRSSVRPADLSPIDPRPNQGHESAPPPRIEPTSRDFRPRAPA